MRRAPLLLGAAVTVVLVVFAGGYGYHRDELYFLEAGHHLAWSYADQGPVTPLVARLMSDIAPGSLTVLRIPSAIAAGLGHGYTLENAVERAHDFVQEAIARATRVGRGRRCLHVALGAPVS